MTYDFIDNEKELQLLHRSLTRAKGFQLYLVQCNNSRLRTEILASLKQLLETNGITVYYHHLKKQMVSLDDFLPPGFPIREKEKAVLIVSGLENSFSPAADSLSFLQRLNYARDLLPKKVPVPLVLWLPVGTFKKILTEAHDLWSWRSGTFYFSTPPEMIQSQIQKMVVLREKEGKGALSKKLYKEQLGLFTDILEDLKHQPDSRKTHLQEADVMQQIGELHYSYADTLLMPDQKTGYLEKALKLQLKALEIKESIMGKSHPEVTRFYDNLSSIYQDMGQLDRALEFQEKALQIRKTVLDKNHPDLAASYNNLSLIYKALGQLDRALEYQQQALQIRETVLDKNHPSLAVSYNNLSTTYYSLGQLDRALEFQEKALQIEEAVLDKNHPALATLYNNLSSIYQDLGQLERALEFQEKALQIREVVLSKNHPDLAASYNNLSSIYQDLGQLERALEFQEKVLEIWEAVLDKNHPSFATSYHNLSVIYRTMKDYHRARAYAQKAVAILEKLFPNGHPDLDVTKKNFQFIEEQLTTAAGR